ncbi:helix-turn-helix domain-containing protein [Humitalea sp. 24SJ18S-53]|uniref:helix-turn-helix domain-containing protein n=1 Tax=Humitalea sp. 24SJ18S-53 TaxID=3422307 RepID=UPI003D6742E7
MVFYASGLAGKSPKREAGGARGTLGEKLMSTNPNGYGGTIRLASGLRAMTGIDSRPATISHIGRAPESMMDRAESAPAPTDQRFRMAPFTPGRRTAMGSDTAVGAEVRRLRRAQGKTQKDLAEQVGVTGAQLHRYETGATRIAASRLIAIADALGVRADVLISAGSSNEPSHPVGPASEDDDIVELIQVFGTIADPRHRSALVAVARMMATHYQRRGKVGDPD